MILILIGPAATGKTTFAKQIQNVIPNAVVFDDMTPTDLEEQAHAIKRAVINIGMAIVILDAAKCYRNHDVIQRVRTTVLEWESEFQVSLMESIRLSVL